jgi:ataxia telangiectasia mutated family protein
MAGFIVGLGDRHSSNILLDNETAELIHIDLGIAFDQGSLLKIPEVVPFRLTRDLVDALGVCGVEGPMRGSAEQAMRVLRANTESLLAILQLVVHNPLYKWSQEKQMQERQLQKDPTVLQQPSRNPEAERALSRVQLKLEGREVGRLECLSVEGQVWQLIDQARDPANLCRMFEGWAAWL